MDSTALTTLIFAHYTTKCKEHPELSPPDTMLLEGTLSLLKQNMPDVFDYRVILMYDAPKDPTPDQQRYLAELCKVAEDFKIELDVWSYQSYRKMYLHAFKEVKSRYVFMLEHDWWVEHAGLSATELVAVMDKYPFMNYLKFWNFHDDTERFKPVPLIQPYENDKLVHRDDRVSEFFLFSDSLWSCNPHFGRTSKYVNEWIPKISKTDAYDHINCGAGGIEDVLTRECWLDFKTLPLEQAKAKWGLYLYISHSPMFDHMAG